MKKIFKNTLIVSFVTLALGLSSCEDSVDLRPTDVIDADKAFIAVSDLDQGAIGAYSALSYENTLWTAAIMSDEVRWAIDNNNRNYGLEHKWSFDPGTGNVTAAWGNLYVVIDRINRVLEAMDKVPAANATEEATKARVKGELLALRAFSHFELLRNYASKYEGTALGVPIMLKSEITTPERKSFADVITQVKADLTEAKNLIPATYAVSDFTRITRVGVSAIQARVALYNKDWNDAITFATEVINSRPLAARAAFPNIWTDATSTEVVFALKRAGTSVNVLWTDTNNDVFFSPSDKLVSTFDQANDVRYNNYIKYDGTLSATRERWKVNKYPGQTTAIKFNNVKVFRTSEMYLIRAEANVEKSTSDLVAAAADLNALRSARINNYLPVVFATKTDALSAIDTERFKELAFEGHRYYDIRRRGTAIVRNDSDITTGNAIPKTLNPSDRNYILPIPQAEFLANKNIQQNPGY
ncbi:MAG TPA: RagB/SusD family nutrient uptake outer membrane protein [Daejeonella sp.]